MIMNFHAQIDEANYNLVNTRHFLYNNPCHGLTLVLIFRLDNKLKETYGQFKCTQVLTEHKKYFQLYDAYTTLA